MLKKKLKQLKDIYCILAAAVLVLKGYYNHYESYGLIEAHAPPLDEWLAKEINNSNLQLTDDIKTEIAQICVLAKQKDTHSIVVDLHGLGSLIIDLKCELINFEATEFANIRG